MQRIVHRIRPGTRLAIDPNGGYLVEVVGGGTVKLNEPAMVPLMLVDGRRSAEEIERILGRLSTKLPLSDVGPLIHSMANAGVLEETETAWLPLETQPWPAHRCQGCGASCQGHWVGPLERDFIERTTARMPELREKYPHLVDVKPFVRIDPEAPGLFLNASSGQCCFLDDEMRCILHKEYGSAEKPTICQYFPHIRLEDGSVTRIGVSLMCLKQFDQVLERDPPAPDAQWQAVHEELDGRLFHFYDTEAMHPLEEEIRQLVRQAPDALAAVLARVTPRRALGRGHAGRRLEQLSLQHLERVEKELAQEPIIVALCKRPGLLSDRLNALRALGRREGGPAGGGLRVASVRAAKTRPRLEVLADGLLRFHFLRHYVMFHTIPHAIAGFSLGVWAALAATPPGDRANSRFGESLATWMRTLQSPGVREHLFGNPAEVDTYLEAFERFWKGD